MSNPVLAPSIGTPDGILDEFNTPSAYYPGTLRCYLNGQLIRNTDDDGIIELGGTSVRHKKPPLENDKVDYYYHESAPTGGAIQGPPDMLEAFELHPEIYAIVDLRPDIIGAEDQSPEQQRPQMIGNEHLVPEMVSALDLRPEIISAEEV